MYSHYMQDLQYFLYYGIILEHNLHYNCFFSSREKKSTSKENVFLFVQD